MHSNRLFSYNNGDDIMLTSCLVLLVILSTMCCSPDKALAAEEFKLIPVLSLLLSSGSSPYCAEANGLNWCRHPEAIGGANCNDVCAANGMTPVVDNTAWLQAQDSVAKCEAIRDAVGVTGTINLGSYNYACAEYSITTNKFTCSTFSGCPNEHRTGADDGTHWFSICPCEKGG